MESYDMIGKLRRRFVQVAMAALLAVMLVLVIAINLVFYYQSKRSQEGVMDRIVELELPDNIGAELPDIPEADASRLRPEPRRGRQEEDTELPFATGYVVMHFDHEMTLTETDVTNTSFMEADVAEEYAAEIIAAGQQEGWLGNQFFRVNETGDGYMMILMDGGNMRSSIRSVLLISIGVALIGYLLVFVLVVLFSRRAIQPVVESYEKQKQFITDAGHELKTPLTVISANTEIARMSFGECEWFDGIDKQTERMKYLVQNLISLTKMDEESTIMVKEKFAIGDAVYDTAMSYKGIAEQQDRVLRVNTARDIMYSGDESAIRQVVAILLDNAVKCSNPGGEIDVNLTAGRNLTLTVANTGEQLEQIETERVFDRFYRGDRSRSAEGGYGLGLSIARAIVERHGGTIRARKAEENWIVFEVHL